MVGPQFASSAQQTPAAATGLRTVFGVPLAPDERVVYFRAISHNPLMTGLVSILFIPLLFLGVFGILNAMKMREKGDWAQVVTNRRVFAVNCHGQVLRQMEWSRVTTIHSLTVRNRGLREVGVVDANRNRVLFFNEPGAMLAFLEPIQKSPALLQTLPEVAFPADKPAYTPGDDEKKIGSALVAFGGLGVFIALFGVNRSSKLPVGFLSLLVGVGGALIIMMANGKAKRAVG